MTFEKSRKFATYGVLGTIRVYARCDSPESYVEIPIKIARKYLADMEDAITVASAQVYFNILDNEAEK